MQIFFVSSPQEAIALRLIKPDKSQSIIVVVSYYNTTDLTYSEVIRHILRTSGYEYLSLRLYMHRNSFNVNRPLRAIHETRSNIRIISDFSKKYLSGALYSRQHLIYAQKDSPILDLIPRTKSFSVKTICVDHAPADRLPRSTFGNPGIAVRAMFSKGLTYLRHTPNSFFTKLFTMVLKRITSLYYPSYCGSGPSAGYSWTPERNFHCLSYKDAQLTPKLKLPKANSKACILLVDHPSLYKNVPNIQQDLSSLCMPKVYANMCHRHISHPKRILLKHHPNILQRMTSADLTEYNHQIVAEISRLLPFVEVFPISECFYDPIESLYPIETLIHVFNVDMVLGMYSSSMYLLQSFNDIEVISDCEESLSFRELRQRESSDLQFGFKVS